MSQPPPGGRPFRVAIADQQTAGRGRHYRRWVSPPGAGLYMSFAYSFEDPPENLPSLTLAIGVGVIAALQEFNIEGVSLKWPNDIVALDGKLGGILTEFQSGTTSRRYGCDGSWIECHPAGRRRNEYRIRLGAAHC